MIDPLTVIAEAVSAPYGMAASDTLTYLAVGERPHGNAKPGECGAVDPRDEANWCRESAGHSGDHSPVASPPTDCGALLDPPNPYRWCTHTPGHQGDCE